MDWDAIKRRIEGAVESGRMTREEADAKYREIKKQVSREGRDDGVDWAAAKATSPEEWSDELKAQIVAAGHDLEEVAEKFRQRQQAAATRAERGRDDGIEGHFRRIGVTDEMVDRIRVVLNESGLQGKQIEPALGGMLRVVYEMKSEGEEFELDPRLQDYFQNRIGLTDEQIELVQGIARRILHSLKERGAKKGAYEKVITKPLVKTDDCKYIVEGTIEYLKDGKTVAVVDYGNGECDNIATKTVDGKTYEFELNKKEKEPLAKVFLE